ncbi:MAG: 50S ribosomal protein L10 [Candidatus Aenigmarchaeota archaeon]|nr:50S ribosomal protein L10 [Candidatus Aenigmarchaeota archaeon]
MLKSRKAEEVEKLAVLAREYSVIGLLNIRKMPTKQMQKIKANLKGKAIVKVSKNILIRKAMEKADKDLGALSAKLSGESAIIFSNDNPFRLFAMLKANRIPSAAKAGDVAPDDITVQKGPTGLPPGPAITTLQKLGLKTTVEAGKISVADDKIVAKKGAIITKELANGFNLLKMQPMQIGVDMIAAWEQGVIYASDILNIDEDEYKRSVERAVVEAFNLAVNANYPTKETINVMISKAFHEAKSLAIAGNVTEKEFIGEVLAKAVCEAKALETKAGNI